MLGTKVKPDLLLSELKVDEYAAIVFVGASEHWDGPSSRNTLDAPERAKKPLHGEEAWLSFPLLRPGASDAL